MSNKAFQERVRILRKCRSMSLTDLAKTLSVSKNCISMWENGSAVPKHNTLIALSKFFDVPIDYLLGNDLVEAKKPESIEFKLLQKYLAQLDDEQLKKASDILHTVFGDVFHQKKAVTARKVI